MKLVLRYLLVFVIIFVILAAISSFVTLGNPDWELIVCLWFFICLLIFTFTRGGND